MAQQSSGSYPEIKGFLSEGKFPITMGDLTTAQLKYVSRHLQSLLHGQYLRAGVGAKRNMRFLTPEVARLAYIQARGKIIAVYREGWRFRFPDDFAVVIGSVEDESILFISLHGDPSQWGEGTGDHLAVVLADARAAARFRLNTIDAHASPHLFKRGEDVPYTNAVYSEGIVAAVSGMKDFLNREFAMQIVAEVKTECRAAYSRELDSVK